MALVIAELEVQVRVGEREWSIGHGQATGATTQEIAAKLAQALRDMGDALVSEAADGNLNG